MMMVVVKNSVEYILVWDPYKKFMVKHFQTLMIFFQVSLLAVAVNAITLVEGGVRAQISDIFENSVLNCGPLKLEKKGRFHTIFTLSHIITYHYLCNVLRQLPNTQDSAGR